MEGDMPTTCTSPYLMTVTNVNAQDVKQNAGFGAESIDMAAPGTGTVTTGYAGGQAVYTVLGGTSSAAPHVTGAIALMYSLNCSEITKDALTQPILVAERFRDLIFNHLDDNATLKNITKREGRLNLYKPLLAAQDAYCDQTFGDLVLEQAFISTGKTFAYSGVVPDAGSFQFRVHNTLGQLMFETTILNSTGGFSGTTDASLWGAGAYFASISRGKQIASKKFLKF
jgi:subtilisin family serine protease